ncbi:hypothetical protein HPB50_025433 [Hyalomma asiaticum]|uniref:Uncharacterized protein n=1 Tax=Hyalomma asiaticum TaxID=266040 RepID=A0ACB7SIN0_HYAAI|nr:hypothetical protein HPB50_025433 [Hyalomma asiaticum]
MRGSCRKKAKSGSVIEREEERSTGDSSSVAPPLTPPPFPSFSLLPLSPRTPPPPFALARSVAAPPATADVSLMPCATVGAAVFSVDALWRGALNRSYLQVARDLVV